MCWVPRFCAQTKTREEAFGSFVRPKGIAAVADQETEEGRRPSAGALDPRLECSFGHNSVEVGQSRNEAISFIKKNIYFPRMIA